MTLFREGKAVLEVAVPKVVSRQMPAFFNPKMARNRDLLIALLACWPHSHLHMADPLAGTGVRGIRCLLELPRRKIDAVAFNDASPRAIAQLRSNVERNGLKESPRLTVSQQDANLFLLNSRGFDVIDLDPFGSPAPFLEAAVQRLSRRGLLAVTATDTAALAGTSPKVCLRRYWARPLRNELMHEIGLRILIRRAQLVGAAHERALLPVLAYAHEHYYRAVFASTKSKQAADAMIAQHAYYRDAGPMWVGPLGEAALLAKMKSEAHADFLALLCQEAAHHYFGFFDLHLIAKGLKGPAPQREAVIDALHAKGFGAHATHFSGKAVKTDATIGDVREVVAALAGGPATREAL